METNAAYDTEIWNMFPAVAVRESDMIIIVNREVYDVSSVMVADLDPSLPALGENDTDLHLHVNDGRHVIVRTKKATYEKALNDNPSGPWVIDGKIRMLLKD